jgi:hypothetical protein
LRLDAQFPWLAAAFAPRPTRQARLQDRLGHGSHQRTDPTTHRRGPIAGQPLVEFPGRRARDLPTLA